MARIQILELPAEHHGDEITTPFVLVIDQWTNPFITARREIEEHLKQQTSARAVLFFEETVDIA